MGTSFHEDKDICGLYATSWVQLVIDSYSIASGVVTFNGWPDGASLLEQESTTVNIFHIVLNELLEVAKNAV